MSQGPSPVAPPPYRGGLALQRILRRYAELRFQALVPDCAVTTAECPANADASGDQALIHGSMQAIVLLAGRDLRVTFKAHYSRIDLPDLVARRGAGAQPVAQQKAVLQDFFREYVNLTAGGVKAELQRCGIDCGISLPVTTSGLDELFFADRLTNRCLTDHWRISATGTTFVCTSAIDLGSAEAVDTVVFIPDDSCEGDGSEGSVEFL